MPEGTPMMIKLAGIIRGGSKTFLRIQFRTVAVVVVFLAIVFSLFIETWSGLTFLLGATMSSAVCILGMQSATHANVRTTDRARNTFSVGETVKVALMGGSISGLAVQACGTFGLVLILCIRGGVDPTAGNLADSYVVKKAPAIKTSTVVKTNTAAQDYVKATKNFYDTTWTKTAQSLTDSVGTWTNYGAYFFYEAIEAADSRPENTSCEAKYNEVKDRYADLDQDSIDILKAEYNDSYTKFATWAANQGVSIATYNAGRLGDNNNIGLFVGIGAAAISLIVAVYFVGKRRRA